MALKDAMAAKMRRMAEQWLIDECSIWRPERSLDAYGTPSQTLSNVDSAIRCRVITAGDANQSGVDVGAQVLAEDQYQVALPVGTDVQIGDVIQVRTLRYRVVRLISELSQEFFEMVLVERQRGSDDGV